jgi:hypothetical protein
MFVLKLVSCSHVRAFILGLLSLSGGGFCCAAAAAAQIQISRIKRPI